jgi:glycosyltransferase involved in cell wall biosynthesis
MISIIFPAYNEEGNVKELHASIKKTLDSMGENYEIVAVDNGSTDFTLERLKQLSPIKIIVIAKNIGQTAGLDAGIRNAEGDIIVFIDADLQNDPQDIPKLISKLREGYDVVSGWRWDRKDPFDRRVLSRFANWLTSKISGLYLHDSACALKAYRREVLASVHLYGEMHVFLPAYLHMRGAKVAEIPVKHHARKHGISKHHFMKAVKDIFDLVTIKFLTGSMTSRPLVFFGGIGAISGLLGCIVGMIAFYLKLAGIYNFGQTPLLPVSIFFILSGIMFFMLGFLAELMLRTYFETNKKTPYVIKERIENK